MTAGGHRERADKGNEGTTGKMAAKSTPGQTGSGNSCLVSCEEECDGSEQFSAAFLAQAGTA